MKASFETTSKNFGGLIVFAIVAWLIYFIGVVACFVGVLVSIPVSLLAITYVFRHLNGRQVAPV